MAKRPTITTITNGYTSGTALNANLTALRDAFDNTLSLDGSTPNAMGADLDMNSNDILNAGSVAASSLTLNGISFTTANISTNWQGDWAASTFYNIDNLVSENGSTYICLVEHTSGSTFSVDLSAGKWALFASKGDAGDGTGDMLASNNLSDIASAPAALGNLGLTATAAEINTLDGITASTAELNILDGVTATTAELNILDGVTANAARINASALEFIATADASSDAAIDFTGFDATKYDAYLFVLQNVKPVTDGDAILFRLSNDGGSTFTSTSGSYGWQRLIASGSGVTAANNLSTAQEVYFTGGVGNAAGEDGASGEIWVTGAHLSSRTSVRACMSYRDSTASGLAICSSAGERTTGEVNNAARFLGETGNILSGTITMYGMRNG